MHQTTPPLFTQIRPSVIGIAVIECLVGVPLEQERPSLHCIFLRKRNKKMQEFIVSFFFLCNEEMTQLRTRKHRSQVLLGLINHEASTMTAWLRLAAQLQSLTVPTSGICARYFAVGVVYALNFHVIK